MSTVQHDPLIANWILPLVPPELLDPFALDDDSLGLLEYELRTETPPPSEPSLPLKEWIQVQVAYYASLETPTARWLAGKIATLASDCLRHAATTPAELDARLELEDDDRDVRLRAQGYDSAMRALERDGFDAAGY